MSEQPDLKESPPLQEQKQESTNETKAESLAASERRQRRQRKAEEQAIKERIEQSPQQKSESTQQQQIEEKKEVPQEQVQQQQVVFKQPDPQTNIQEKSSKPILFGLKFQLGFITILKKNLNLDNLEKYLRKRTEQDFENKDLLFSLSDQRKSESLKLLKDWVKDRTDQFELSRDILEELISVVDIRSRLSVEFLQICYKFFVEKCQHEAQYAKFLLTKPQPNFVHNSVAQTMYLQIANAISELDNRNIKHQLEVSNFASTIETDILNAPIFAEFATLDEKSDNLVKALSIQRKQLQNLLYSASSKLNQIIPLFPSTGTEPQQVQQPSQVPLGPQGQQNRNRKPIFDQPQQKGISDYVISGLSNFGQMFIGPFVYEKSFDESSATDKQEKPEKQAMPSPKEAQKTEQQGTEEEGKSSQKSTPPTLEKRTSEDQLKKSDQFIKSNQDLFLLIWSLIKTQDQANSLLNQVVEKFLSYWEHVIIVEKKRSKWINEAVVQYNNLYSEIYPQNKPFEIKTPTDKDVEDAYSLQAILTPEVFTALKSRQQDICRQNIKESLFLHSVPCQAAKILIVKEFKVNQAINNHQEIPSQLILSIDKYLGLWNLLDSQNVENIEKPVFHCPITSLQIHKVNKIIVELIPSKHLLFVNIGQEKQKIQVKFTNPDDLEEFLTVIEVQKI